MPCSDPVAFSFFHPRGRTDQRGFTVPSSSTGKLHGEPSTGSGPFAAPSAALVRVCDPLATAVVERVSASPVVGRVGGSIGPEDVKPVRTAAAVGRVLKSTAVGRVPKCGGLARPPRSRPP